MSEHKENQSHLCPLLPLKWVWTRGNRCSGTIWSRYLLQLVVKWQRLKSVMLWVPHARPKYQLQDPYLFTYTWKDTFQSLKVLPMAEVTEDIGYIVTKSGLEINQGRKTSFYTICISTVHFGRSAVQVSSKLSDWFKMTIRSRQDNPISPSTSKLCLERLMDEIMMAKEFGINVPGKQNNHQHYCLSPDKNSG